MILVDANLLLYAYHTRAEQHERSRAWLEAALSGPDPVGLAWLSLWAFLRIATNPRVFERPLSTQEAETAVSAWLAQPAAEIPATCNAERPPHCDADREPWPYVP